MDRKLLRIIIAICFLVGGTVFWVKQEFIYSIVFFVVAVVYLLNRGKRNE